MYEFCKERYQVGSDCIKGPEGIHYTNMITFMSEAGCDERCQYVCKILQDFDVVVNNIKERKENEIKKKDTEKLNKRFRK